MICIYLPEQLSRDFHSGRYHFIEFRTAFFVKTFHNYLRVNGMKKPVLIIYIFISAVLILSSCARPTASRQMLYNQNKQSDESSNDISSEILTEKSNSESSYDEKDKSRSQNKSPVIDDGKYDVDLTVLNSTMTYSQVFEMLYYPEQYIGKKVKMNGAFVYGEDNGNRYYFCRISDATACCSQGIEFVLGGECSFPKDYPRVNSEIAVVGIFETYYEDDVQYCRLANSVLV